MELENLGPIPGSNTEQRGGPGSLADPSVLLLDEHWWGARILLNSIPTPQHSATALHQSHAKGIDLGGIIWWVLFPVSPRLPFGGETQNVPTLQTQLREKTVH